MRAEDILARFDDVSDQPDGGYLARCPAHGDSRPSLRIWFGDDGRVRMTCRAGCATADVISKVGLCWADMFGASGQAATVSSKRPETVGTAEIASLRVYLDQASDNYGLSPAASYALERFGVDGDLASLMGLGYDDGSLPGLPYRSRGFRQFPRLIVPLVGFDGVARGLQGRDISGDCPARWMSLSNPEGLRWSQYGYFPCDSDTVLVTEGPGDGLTAVAAGFSAVVVRGAALARSPELVQELADGLKGRRVVVAGDNDRSGNDFTRRLADGLSAHGITTYRLTIPHDGDDLTDWRARNVSDFPNALADAVRSAQPVQADSPQLVDTATGVLVPDADQVQRIVDLYYKMLRQYGASDVLNAHLLVAFADGCIKYAPGLGFFTWNGRVWERSDRKVRQTVHFIGMALMTAAAERSAQKKDGDKEDPGEHLRKAAKGFTTRRKIDDLMAELQSVPAVHVEVTDFDSQPDLLSFRNGTVDLRTGELREHRKEDLLTYCLDIDYKPQAQAPRWLSFLEEIFPDQPDMPEYMQRLTGYGLTGHTSEQCFAVLYGKGANGKSVFTETLTSVFRPITETTPFSTFEEKTSGGIPNDIAALRGARFVMASEGESGKPMSEAVLKRVTGKDAISARFLRKEFFTFRPTFLLMLATNYRPRFRGQDEGLWRRVKLIPFRRFFAPEERDYALDQKLVAEAEGIAAWAVRGAMEWYQNGLQDPAQIQEATKDYRRTSDALAGFFPGVLERCDDSHTMTAGEAYQAYKMWAESEGLPAREQWTRRTFLEAMEERQVPRRNTMKGVCLVGVRLVSDHHDVPAGPGIFGQ